MEEGRGREDEKGRKEDGCRKNINGRWVHGAGIRWTEGTSKRRRSFYLNFWIWIFFLGFCNNVLIFNGNCKNQLFRFLNVQFLILYKKQQNFSKLLN